MIRFIRIGNQMNSQDDAFAFYDTVIDNFIEIGGDVVFNCIEDFKECARIEIANYMTDGPYASNRIDRMLRLIPKDVK